MVAVLGAGSDSLRSQPAAVVRQSGGGAVGRYDRAVYVGRWWQWGGRAAVQGGIRWSGGEAVVAGGAGMDTHITQTGYTH